VISQPKNIYSEQALRSAGRIEFTEGNYHKAIADYKELESFYSSPGNVKEARIAIMRSYYELKDYDEALKASRQVSGMGKISPEVSREASYIIARSLEETGRDALALEEYKKLSVEVLSKEGAEAKFKVAQILFKQGKYREADKVIEDFSKKSSSHTYWIARSYILWADVMVKQGQVFQAVETLQSIIDYYEVSSDDILPMAKRKKAEYMAIQQANEQPREADDVEINIE
jgi:tetratricopeptide (TPR) repeat protein